MSAAARLWLMREFLTFVDAEMVWLAERWPAHRRHPENDTPNRYDVAR